MGGCASKECVAGSEYLLGLSVQKIVAVIGEQMIR